MLLKVDIYFVRISSHAASLLSRCFLLSLSFLSGICSPNWRHTSESLTRKMSIFVENFVQQYERIFSCASQPKLSVAGFIQSTTLEYIFQ